LLRIKINITRKLLVRLIFFAVLTGAAFVVDAYLDKNPVKIDTVETDAGAHDNNPGDIYLLDMSFTTPVQNVLQKNTVRKMLFSVHDKFLRNYHSMRNYQVVKSETRKPAVPLIALYHRLEFQTHLFPPDDDILS